MILCFCRCSENFVCQGLLTDFLSRLLLPPSLYGRVADSVTFNVNCSILPPQLAAPHCSEYPRASRAHSL